MELPPELLALLESDNPPTLYLKSATPSTPTGVAHALLSTPGKTYRIQQKNSSNPIMILQPAVSSTPQSNDSPFAMPQYSVRTIATIEDTLELHAQDEDAAAAPPRVNKWHEKFASTRLNKKAKD